MQAPWNVESWSVHASSRWVCVKAPAKPLQHHGHHEVKKKPDAVGKGIFHTTNSRMTGRGKLRLRLLKGLEVRSQHSYRFLGPEEIISQASSRKAQRHPEAACSRGNELHDICIVLQSVENILAKISEHSALIVCSSVNAKTSRPTCMA